RRIWICYFEHNKFLNEFFLQHFLHHCENRDDMLFFVRKHEKRGVSRYIPKFETAIEVFRKDSRKLPKCDPDIDWEDTVYLNLIFTRI
ncbi:uncharacterized protein KIAA0930, partial [Caerostris extrusa]